MARAVRQDFSEKVVWITGASSGIGEALSYLFRNRGAKVVISSNEEDELLSVKHNCPGHEHNVLVLPLDLTEFDSFDKKVDEVVRHFGKIDILVNNGGISHRSAVKDTSLEVLRKVMGVDFTGHAALTRAVLPHMLGRRAGHIVVTSSLAGKMSFPTRAAYCAAKHALQGFFNALRAEIWRDNITVTLICPAGVRTRIGYSSLTGDGGKYGKTDRHIEAGLTPEVCAALIVKAITQERREVWLGNFSQRFPAHIAQYLPSVYAWLINHLKSLN
jgi:short-subunit dehydrogenase